MRIMSKKWKRIWARRTQTRCPGLQQTSIGYLLNLSNHRRVVNTCSSLHPSVYDQSSMEHLRTQPRAESPSYFPCNPGIYNSKLQSASYPTHSNESTQKEAGGTYAYILQSSQLPSISKWYVVSSFGIRCPGLARGSHVLLGWLTWSPATGNHISVATSRY